MKRLIFALILLSLLVIPARAADLDAPEVGGEGKTYFSPPSGSFGNDVLKVLTKAFQAVQPDLINSLKNCVAVLGAVLLLSVLGNMDIKGSRMADHVGVLAVSSLLIAPAGSVIRLGAETIDALSEYGKLLLPVLTASLAAQGGTTSSAVLYVGTMTFDTVLVFAVRSLFVPLLYACTCLCIANRFTDEPVLNSLQKSSKSLITWSLKILVYIFTGYLTITGVVGNTADATAIKAAKLTISGAVPVIGGVVSDASDAVLTGAAVIKNSVGIYGLLALLSVLIGPFLRIGIRYLSLKLTAAICETFGSKRVTELIRDFTAIMGILLAMTGVCCLLHMISTVCFMKGLN